MARAREAISAAILWGGGSRRMGRDKGLLPWGGGTFLTTLAANLSGVETLLLAAGDRREIPPGPWRAVADQFPGCGPLAGLQAALAACPTPLLFAAAGDMPLAGFDAALALAGHLTADAQAAVPVDAAGRPHPLCALYRRELAPLLTDLLQAGERRATAALERFPVRYVPASALPRGEDTLLNLNTPEAYEAFCRRLGPTGHG